MTSPTPANSCRGGRYRSGIFRVVKGHCHPITQGRINFTYLTAWLPSLVVVMYEKSKARCKTLSAIYLPAAGPIAPVDCPGCNTRAQQQQPKQVAAKAARIKPPPIGPKIPSFALLLWPILPPPGGLDKGGADCITLVSRKLDKGQNLKISKADCQNMPPNKFAHWLIQPLPALPNGPFVPVTDWANGHLSRWQVGQWALAACRCSEISPCRPRASRHTSRGRETRPPHTCNFSCRT